MQGIIAPWKIVGEMVDARRGHDKTRNGQRRFHTDAR